MLTLSKRKRNGKNKVIAVWSPTATGKTMTAVNLSAVMSEKYPTALVDLSPTNAAHTWLNCQASGLMSLTSGDPGGYYAPPAVPGLRVYTSEPGAKNIYGGETAALGAIMKALGDCNIIIDAPGDYLKAANIISLADIVVIPTDYNIHGTILLQKYLKKIPSKIFILNRHAEGCPAISSPEEILQQEMLRIPDDPPEVLGSIVSGSPLMKYKSVFQVLFEKVVSQVAE